MLYLNLEHGLASKRVGHLYRPLPPSEGVLMPIAQSIALRDSIADGAIPHGGVGRKSTL